METFKKTALPILASTVWIIVSEFVRNEFVLKSLWVAHYKSLGLTFETTPVNGILWCVWSLLFSTAIYTLIGKFGLLQSTLLSWLVGFVLMWLAIGNLGVLPAGILPVAIPLSILEAFVAGWIIRTLRKTP